MGTLVNSSFLCIHSHSTNVTFQKHKVHRDERAAILGRYSKFRGATLWFTGLSGAGKTTLSFALEKTLIQLGVPAYSLDGDNVRHGLCKNLGFSKDDRSENIRRVAEVAKLFADAGFVTLASFISPFRIDRNEARTVHEQDKLQFFEIYVNTNLDVCEKRDPKNLYKKARSGMLPGFTGVDGDYQAPENPDLVLNAGEESEAECMQKLIRFLGEKGIIPKEVIEQITDPPVRELYVFNEKQKETLIQKATNSPSLKLSLIDLQWVQVLAEGWASPLNGFMRERQYLQSLHFNQIFDLKQKWSDAFEESFSNGSTAKHDASMLNAVNQSIPIVLPISDEMKQECEQGGCVKLEFDGRLIAIMDNVEIFPHRKEERIARQFGTVDVRHPNIKLIMDSGNWLLGGDLAVFERIRYKDGLDKYRLTPMELRKKFKQIGCDAVFAFQLRNPIHNGHALLMCETRQRLLKKYKNPVLLLHPLGGWTKNDDVPLEVRIRQHEEVLKEGVINPEWTVLAIFPPPMLYAGPTEVQWHARARCAAGVNAYIVGRDPAGISHPDTGDYLYDPTHGAKILSMAPGLSNLQIIPFRVAAYDIVNKKMGFFDDSRKDDFIFISGTKMRGLAKAGTEPPEGFMAPKAWKVLANYYRGQTNGSAQLV